MRRLSGVALVLCALVLTLLAAPGLGAQAAPAKPKAKTTLTIRLAPSVVTVNPNGAVEPTAVIAQVTPAVGGRTVTFVRTTDGTRFTARTDPTGRAYWPVDPASLDQTQATSTTYTARVAATSGRRAAGPVAAKLYTVLNTNCSPNPGLVDTSARGEAYCLAARLDRWRKNALMGVGQEINVSTKPWDGPLDRLGAHQPAVIGFDLEELEKAATYSTGTYDQQVIDDLVQRAHDGAVLEASWHAPNPFYPGRPASYTKRGNLAQLLQTDPAQRTAAATRFWQSWDDVLALVKQFQDRPDPTDDTAPCWCTALILRPLHEVNGDFFWWGKPDPATYKQLYTLMQSEAANLGVHNVVWAYAGNRDTSSTTDPDKYVPYHVDLGGLDTYDPEFAKADAPDTLDFSGYDSIAKTLPRMALTEVGPQGSDGHWNPATISRSVIKARLRPAYAMLWFDDGTPTKAHPAPGKKQISSLRGGLAWLESCYDALCYVR